MNNYFLRKNHYHPGKYSEKNMGKMLKKSNGSKLIHKKVQLNSFKHELKYQIVNRLNFNRKSCKRFFSIKTTKNIALYLKEKYKLTSTFNQSFSFNEDFGIYFIRNFFNETKYWSIAKNSFQLRFARQRKKKYFPKKFSQVDTATSHFFKLSFRCMIKSLSKC